MRLFHGFVAAAALAALVPVAPNAQGGNADRVVPGGGIFAPGWKARLDASSLKQGRTEKDSKFTLASGTFTLNIGPAAIYWNPANTASGDYTVKGTFNEPTFQTVNDHPHPYGVFIGGSNLESEKPNLLYCMAYGSGNFIVRGFSSAASSADGAFRMPNGGKPTPHPSVNKAEGIGKPVTQEIALSVKGGRVECSINGAVVAGFDRAEVVGADKLASTDGIYGIRVSHNVDVNVTGFGMTK
jgi:hypothetical protein